MTYFNQGEPEKRNKNKRYTLIDGTSLLVRFGGGGTPEPPAFPGFTELEDEKKRVDRYNSYLYDEDGEGPGWENFYNLVPGLYTDYMMGLKDLYGDIAGKKSQLLSNIYEFLPEVNVLSPEFQKRAQANYDIRKERGLDTFADIYDPLERQITGKAFQNYGGMESSAYNELQEKLAKQKGKAIDEYVNQLDLQRQMEEQQQLGMQSNYLQSMGNTYNLYNLASQEYPSSLTTIAALGNQGVTTYNDLINAIRMLAIQRAQVESSFLASTYATQMQGSIANRGMGMGLLGAGISALGAMI
jgi:hypothetical protein